MGWNFQFSPQHAAFSTLIYLFISKLSARCYADRKNLFASSNCFDNYGVFIWPLAGLPLLLGNLSSARITVLALPLPCFDCLPLKLIR